MTVTPIPLEDFLWITVDPHPLLHPRPIIHRLYPPLEYRMSHEPLEIRVKPAMQPN